MPYDDLYLHSHTNPVLCGIISPDFDAEDANFHLVGVPLDSTSSYRTGAKLGPQKLREIMAADSVECTSEIGVDLGEHYRIKDWGDLIFTQTRITETYDIIKKAFVSLLNECPHFIALGGDHAIATPIHHALNETMSEFSVVYFDAHFDAYDELLGEPLSHGSVMRRTLEFDNFAPEKSAFIGIRDFPNEQKSFLEDHGFEVIYAYEFDEFSLIELASRVSKRLPRQNDRTHVHFSIDLDVFDTSTAPGVSNPTPGGLSARTLFSFTRRLIKSSKLDSLAMVEYNPSFDVSEITGYLAIKYLVEMLGARLW